MVARDTFFDNNVYWSTAASGSLVFPNRSTWAEWHAAQDRNSCVCDPLFADADAFNFTLLPGSPALERGFVPIDLTFATGPRFN